MKHRLKYCTYCTEMLPLEAPPTSHEANAATSPGFVAVSHQTLSLVWTGLKPTARLEHAVYCHPLPPAYRTYRHYTVINGIAPNDT